MSAKYEDLPEDVRRALRKVIDYNWAEERDDAEENGVDGHIFSELSVLENFVTGERKLASQHIEEDKGGPVGVPD